MSDDELEDKFERCVFSRDTTKALGMFVFDMNDLQHDGFLLWVKDRHLDEFMSLFQQHKMTGARFMDMVNNNTLRTTLALSQPQMHKLNQRLVELGLTEEIEEDIHEDTPPPEEEEDNASNSDDVPEEEGTDNNDEEDEEEEDEDDDDDDDDQTEQTEESEQWDLSESSIEDDGTNLWQAAWDGEIDQLEELLEAGADINEPGLDVTNYGLVNIKGQYTAYPAKKDTRVSKGSPLHFAAAAGQAETVEYLLSKGAKWNAQLSDGTTPKMVAKSNGYRDVVTILDKAQGQFDVQSPLYTEMAKRSRKMSATTRDELKKLLRHNVAQEPIEEKELRKEFEKLDTTGQGCITMVQMREAYLSWPNYGVPQSAWEVDDMVQRHSGILDDGMVSFEEFAILRLRCNTR
eukprot:TRINITY_DN67490_c13_g3_i1.p1 TRINITY_DN67490_c13_g3~~TRINITY_DN67490_c13_g3_i1.p1  ORF type:complete len:424 (+),score=69.88 TRINITY_DN67490_c13_g3_i1:65-1273(+)